MASAGGWRPTLSLRARADLLAASKSLYVSPAVSLKKAVSRQPCGRTTAMETMLRWLFVALTLVLPAAGAFAKDGRALLATSALRRSCTLRPMV
jgi:hypothetical protein